MTDPKYQNSNPTFITNLGQNLMTNIVFTFGDRIIFPNDSKSIKKRMKIIPFKSQEKMRASEKEKVKAWIKGEKGIKKLMAQNT